MLTKGCWLLSNLPILCFKSPRSGPTRAMGSMGGAAAADEESGSTTRRCAWCMACCHVADVLGGAACKGMSAVAAVAVALVAYEELDKYCNGSR